MLVKGYEIEVDVEEELEPHLDSFNHHRIRGNKLQACSPFREERHPSFAVNLENGTWIDSGASEEHWRKGNLLSLLSFLMEVTYEEVEEYLLSKYKTIYKDVDSLTLTVQLEQADDIEPVTMEELKGYAFKQSYLRGRGITEKVERAFKIGYDKQNKAVVFVWMDKDGTPANLKFRSTVNKRFWYRAKGKPIKSLVYGLSFIHKLKQETVYVVESEIDALYLWSSGFPAIALGSASMSAKQQQLILNSPITTLVLAFDNDVAGYRCSNNVKERLQGKINLKELVIPEGCKDINDMTKEQVNAATKALLVNHVTFL